MTERYKPNTTVACIIRADQHYLMVEEMIDGRLQYNQPAGHLEPNESLITACQREVQEETGIHLVPKALVGIYQFSANTDLAFVRYTFCASLDKQIAPNPQDPAILNAKWLTFEEILTLKTQLRSPLVLQSLKDYRNNPHYPLSILNDQYLSL
ncbi:NUDIX hydrolase [Shewanella surugensis]|uniref:Phosphatase NudJ n=1 Tax=Shewanella surugensis TaxID=212020 RepID=A0ABT0LGF3_9GAMM|nr:NUDIX hydrolase [Shewanella surugensis]MCL1126787.1 NUDIX hydrolase [Shewanella surugensis]